MVISSTVLYPGKKYFHRVILREKIFSSFNMSKKNNSYTLILINLIFACLFIIFNTKISFKIFVLQYEIQRNYINILFLPTFTFAKYFFYTAILSNVSCFYDNARNGKRPADSLSVSLPSAFAKFFIPFSDASYET